MSIKITIKSLDGNRRELEVESSSTIKSVKKQLEEIEGIRADQLRLIFKGNLLHDNEVLSNKKVENGSLLHSAIMLRGGLNN